MKLLRIEEHKNEMMYDISVENTNTFFANGVCVHNSNAGVCYNNHDGIWYQSRENVITPEKDNAGFAMFASTKESVFTSIINAIANDNGVDLNEHTISLYGEWAGGNIQKKVGIANIPKSFFIFGAKVSKPDDEDFVSFWIENIAKYSSVEDRIYNINDFKTYEVTVDFNVPQASVNRIIEITQEIEKCCPVAQAFGFDGIGEGVVFTAFVNGNRCTFKSKGEEHAVGGKVKTVKPVDNEKVAKIIEVAEKVTPVWRLDQMLTQACDLQNGGHIERRKMGDYIKLVIQDIVKEDSDIIVEAGLDMKEINSKVSDIAKRYFFTREDDEVGLSD